jgi:hypothetical protein
MKGFNIKDIKVTSKEEKHIPQLLTGEYTMGIPKDSDIPKNAEIEGDEYIKYPEGDIQKAVGPDHEKGGIDMAIPEGTEVISKTTKLTKEDVKKINSLYDIDVSTKDSYASAIDKYTKIIGLKKLNDEQADIIEQLKKQMEKKDVSKDTKTINTDYLSNKIYDTEAKKAPLEAKRKEFFDLAFKLQEDKKPKSESANESFKYGGVSGEAFKAMCEKHELTEAEGRAMLGETQSFGDGGKMFEKIQAELKTDKANMSDKEYADQLALRVQEGNLTAEGKSRLQDLWKATPKASASTPPTKGWGSLSGAELEQAKKEWNNNPEAYAAYKLAETKLSDPAFQDAYFEKFKSVAGDDNYYRTKNKDTYKQDLLSLDKKTAVDELLAFEKRNAQLKAFGYTPEGAENAPAKGYTVNQKALDVISKSNGVLKPEDFNKGYRGQAGYLAYTELLNKDSAKGKVYKASATGKNDEPFGGGTISAIDNANTNTTLNQNLNVVESPEVVAPKVEDTKVVEPAKDITDAGIQIPKKRYPQMFNHPDESVLPPTSQTPEVLIQNRFQRIDPVRIGIENNLQAINKSQQFASQQLDALPPSQRAAALTTILGTTQEAENQAILGANTQNANNIINAEQFNIGQSDRENIAQGSNMLNFEQRTLTGKANTEKELRDYLNYNHNIQIKNFENDQKLNLMNSLFPDYQVDFFGNVNYDPSTNFQIQNNDEMNKYLAMASNKPITTTDPEKLNP